MIECENHGAVYGTRCPKCESVYVDGFMPRAGLCNGCTMLLPGSEHCKGQTMGCDCKCRKI